MLRVAKEAQRTPLQQPLLLPPPSLPWERQASIITFSNSSSITNKTVRSSTTRTNNNNYSVISITAKDST